MTGFLNEVFRQTLGTDFKPKAKRKGKKGNRRQTINVNFSSNDHRIAELKRDIRNIEKMINKQKNYKKMKDYNATIRKLQRDRERAKRRFEKEIMGM